MVDIIENARIIQQYIENNDLENNDLIEALKRHDEFMELANRLIELAKQTKKTPL